MTQKVPKRPPSPANTEVLHEKKMSFFTQKEHPAPQILKFCMKIENRPTYRDFVKKNPDPQLHNLFKPITKFFCAFLVIQQFELRHPL